MASHPDLQAEQAFIDYAYERVEATRAAARETLTEALRQRGGTFAAVEEREVMVRTTLQRLEQLDIGREALAFGRIDEESGDVFRIGRLAVWSEEQEPLVVDWRAPVAEPFYRATGRHSMGLRLRRHYATDGRRLVGIEDELFTAGAAGAVDVDGVGVELVGTGALLAALDRTRSGQMRDIVATVQREQDEIIRAELPGVLVVQGGPGTGKTAVALHRAAYLLYTYRFPLERQGVLVVGPNTVFLRYIGQVLPSLGESGVTLTTVEGLVAAARVQGVDSALAARAKGDARMARVIARAVRDRERPLRRDLRIGWGPVELWLTVEATEQIVATARRRPGQHNAKRRFVETLVARRLHQQLIDALERRVRVNLRGAGERQIDDEADGEAPEATAEMSVEDMLRELRRHPVVAPALDRIWPVLRPEELLHDLFGARPLLALAGRGVLADVEWKALARPRSDALDAIPWTVADMPLLDEARVLLGSRRPHESEVRTYGHIVVDEAQDLTPMQLRMLTRRSLSGSMTIVGDIAQATGHRAPRGWDDITAHLPDKRSSRTVELSVNYRTPAEIMELAGRVLRVATPHLVQPRSVRSTGEHPEFHPVDEGGVVSETARLVATLTALPDGGSIAVIVAPSMRASIEAGLVALGVDFGVAESAGLSNRVTVVPIGVVKGLEFDSVMVIEPAAIVRESPQGLRALYVALTRSTKRLAVLHAEPLPVAMQVS